MSKDSKPAEAKPAKEPSALATPKYVRVRFVKDFVFPADGIDQAALEKAVQQLRMQAFPACDVSIEETVDAWDGRMMFVDGNFQRTPLSLANIAALKALVASDGETATISDEGPAVYVYLKGLAPEVATQQGFVLKYVIASKTEGVWVEVNYFKSVLQNQQAQMQQAQMMAQQQQAQGQKRGLNGQPIPMNPGKR